MDRKDAKYFVSAGYEVLPGENGGFVMKTRGDYGGGRLVELAAFTNHLDLIAYLNEGHAAYAKGAA